ncbi:MAG: hypothetical protein DHS20C15_16330 [Planctomycetota bacterium]|nr:MAG: hypothetical protein DHS20C15_16330 [Planctomycetota bacterium]
MSALQLVCFDAADTLFTERSSRAELYADAFAEHGHAISAAQMSSWMSAANTELSRPDAPQPRYSRDWFRAFVGALLTRAGSREDPEALRALLEDRFTRPENYIVFGDVLPCLDALLERGLRLAVVSNWSDRLPGLLRDLGLAHAFEELAVSARVGFDKPDARLFTWLLERMNVSPEHALHVGDHAVNDVLGARRAGLRALQIDRSGQQQPSVGCITDLAQVPGLLEA